MGQAAEERVKSAEVSLVASEVGGELRSLVSELRSAGKSFATELHSACLSLHNAEKSLLRQASMPSLKDVRDAPSNGQSMNDMSGSLSVPANPAVASYSSSSPPTGMTPFAANLSLLSPAVLAPAPQIRQLPAQNSFASTAPVSLQDYIATSPAMMPPERNALSGWSPPGDTSSFADISRLSRSGPSRSKPSQTRLRGFGRQPIQPQQGGSHSTGLQPGRSPASSLQPPGGRPSGASAMRDKFGALDAKILSLDAKFRQLGATSKPPPAKDRL